MTLAEPNSTAIVAEEKPGEEPHKAARVGFLFFDRVTTLRSLIQWGSKGGLAILDQGLISGSNFLISVLLARWLMADQYGAYAVAFAVYVLFMIVYQALVLEPMAVFGGSSFRNNLRGYLRSLLWIHVALSLAIVLVLAVSVTVVHGLGLTAGLPGALAGLMIASPCMQLFWLARRSSYLELSPTQAAMGSFLYSTLVLGALYLVNRHGLLSPFGAFLLMGLGSAGTAVTMLLRLRSGLRRGGPVLRSREVWCRHWTYGRWALASCIASWIPTYIYYPLLSSFAGMAQSGQLKALMNFTLPLEQTKAALSLLFLPYAAGVLQEGKSSARVLCGSMALVAVGGTAAYWAVIVPLRGPIFHTVYSGRYTEAAHLIPLVALGSIFAGASYAPAIILRAMELPSALFSAFAVATFLSLLVGVPATWAFGLPGAIWGSVLADVASFVTVSLILRRNLLARKSV